ncbi:MAG: endonuclease domain-containing protein, partial [Actinomycetota bacterium]
KARLPLPIAQFEICDGPSFVARVDFAYPDAKLAIEVDGYEVHGQKSTWDSDQDKRARLVSLGWRVMPITDEQIRQRPAAIVARVRRALDIPT